VKYCSCSFCCHHEGVHVGACDPMFIVAVVFLKMMFV